MKWQPIETCPPWKVVLLYCPERSPWAATAWKGMKVGGDSRNHGYDVGFKLATPYGVSGSGHMKQVWCPIESHNDWPTHWMDLPEPPNEEPQA
jgi:hypothetical protein